jgi:SAM-dependent methyltransferase
MNHRATEGTDETTLRVPIFAATLFFSAFLLFTCQPMVGKMLLPYLGGAAAVWTTCVLFFQFMLLLGYVYAHALARMIDLRKQVVIHVLVLLTPLAFLPIHFETSSAAFALHPLINLLSVLTASAAVPFFVVSATAPLLQNWFSRSRDAASSDPYFLYSASNAGSLIALMAYPFGVEPRIGIAAQSRLWLGGYVGLILMFGLTVAAGYDRRYLIKATPAATGRRPGWTSRLFWLAASFVPSALMLAVTNHIAANVASAPFLWLVPLALYLLTFIFAFGRGMRASQERVSRAMPLLLLAVFPLVTAGVIAPPGWNWILAAAHLLLLFIGALACHTRLSESRPGAEHLTEFYFWVALGGVLGGIFTATLAPAMFNSVIEYPLLVVTLPFFRGGRLEKSDVWIAGVTAIALSITWIIFRLTHLESNSEALAFVHTAVFFAGYKLRGQRQRFAWFFAAITLTYAFILPRYIEGASRVHEARNFFGVKKVLDDPNSRLRKLLHGDTIHGIESTDPAKSGQPLSYYYSGGSISDAVDVIRERGGAKTIGVIGLGAGSMAAYADATHHIRFYEIDASVESIARRYFTFLSRCGSNCDVIIGDGRLQLEREPNGTLDLLLLDAFSSDSIPTHLLSREALEMYLAKLKPDGVLVFHVSNRYLNVEKLVSALALDAGLIAFSRFDDAGDLRNVGKSSANHVVAAHRLQDLGDLPSHAGWNRVTRPPDLQPWTDDYSNLLSLMRWH